MKKVMFSLFAAMMLIGVQAMAQDEKPMWQPSVDISFSYGSRYLSDGWVINPESMLFGDINLTWNLREAGEIYIGTWFANDWNDYNRDSKVKYEPEEWDYWVGYAYTLGGLEVIDSVTFDLSYTYWDYPKRTKWPQPGETERKIKLDISTGKIAVTESFTWKPGFMVGWDHENDEWQASIYVKSTATLIDNLKFNNGLELFWSNGRWRCGGYDGVHHLKREGLLDSYKNGLSTLVWSSDLTYEITENISFGPFAQLAWVLDHDYREVWKSESSPNSKSGMNTLWGIKLSFSF